MLLIQVFLLLCELVQDGPCAKESRLIGHDFADWDGNLQTLAINHL